MVIGHCRHVPDEVPSVLITETKGKNVVKLFFVVLSAYMTTQTPGVNRLLTRRLPTVSVAFGQYSAH
jgi:hypothetical protein